MANSPNKLPLKPFQIRFGPRDLGSYDHLIEQLKNVQLGYRGQVAKILMLKGLESGAKIPDIFKIDPDAGNTNSEKPQQQERSNKERDKPKPNPALDAMVTMGKKNN